MGYRIVRMSRQLFEQMFTEGYTLPDMNGMRLHVTKGLPQGAKLDAVSENVFFNSGEIALRFFHPDWPEDKGFAIPETAIEFTMEPTPHRPDAGTYAEYEATFGRSPELAPEQRVAQMRGELRDMKSLDSTRQEYFDRVRREAMVVTHDDGFAAPPAIPDGPAVVDESK